MGNLTGERRSSVPAMRNRSSSTPEAALSGPYLRAFGLLIAYGDMGAGPRHGSRNHAPCKCVRRSCCRGDRYVNGSADTRLALTIWVERKSLVSEEVVNKFESEGWG
ncbi:hypothetical protein GGE43_002527 [Agrobacterium tumefaciens]|uniref:Uncharacterized protein n=1 Tax=Agrobacterium radiobacter TaxID=362 RepID=A0ABR6J929_AGRRD|nr:hypothetical protein [Agrobacterium radiobacter]MBB4318772.1 hypothetical protein [Agrobacterium radiobacter]MBB4324041.1 hypothetical protein [Agrobacterium radiobacter]MBB4336321.1 hypothetical protein [Agrobacterium radiobacter]MBB4486552.1 hypothetical protein [Agrobacterium radiobacter]